MNKSHSSNRELSNLGFDIFDEGDSWLGTIRQVQSSWSFETLGSYQILEEAGRGGQAIVYKARELSTGKIVALKRLTSGRFSSHESLQRFERELETIARLRHPGIVRLLDVHTTEEHRLLVMPWIDGLPINQWAQEVPSLRDRLETFLRLCDAVQHAHERGVLHRDLKPKNILVDPDGQPIVLDFGLAKNKDLSEGTLTQSGEGLGTPAYAAPEQFFGEGSSDERADVYSLGVVLFELVAGIHPFHDVPNMARLVELLNEGAAPRLSRYVETADRDLETVIQVSMERVIDRRYSTVVELSSDLRRHLRGEAIVASRPSAWVSFLRLAWRHKLTSGLIMIVVLGAVVFGSVATVQANRLRLANAKSEAARKAAQASEKQARAALDRAEEEAARTQEVLAYLSWNVLGGGNPRLSRPDVSLQDVLDGALNGLSESFEKRPLLAGQLRLILADSFFRIGNYQRAESLASEIRVDPTTPHGFEIHLNARDTLVNALLNLGEFDRGEAVLRETLDLLEEHPLENPTWHCRLLARLARTMQLQGRPEEAESHLRESFLLSDQGTVLGPELFVDQQMLLSSSLREQGKRDGAIEALYRALEYLQDHQMNRSSAYVLVQMQLADFASSNGDYLEAEARLREACDLQAEIFGSDHPDTAYSKANLGFLLVCTGQSSGVKLLEDACVILREQGDSPRLASVLLQTSIALRSHGDLDRAYDVAMESLEHLEGYYGDEQLGAARALESIGTIELSRGEIQDAIDAFEECLERSADLANAPWLRMRATIDLAKCYALVEECESATEFALSGAKTLLSLVRGSHRLPKQETVRHLLEALSKSEDPAIQQRAVQIQSALPNALQNAQSAVVIDTALDYLLHGSVETNTDEVERVLKILTSDS